MRYGWLAAAMAALSLWPMDLAAGQEGPGASAEESQQADSEEARRERLRRLREGNVAKLEIGDQTVAVSYGDTPTDGPDYRQLESIQDNGFVMFTESIVTKLKTDLDLTFGDKLIKTENVAEDYPGVYGLWLKRAGEEWHLVFNEYADVWGTQHFPEGDVAEVPLTHAALDEPTEQFTVELTEADGGGVLHLKWGHHEWTAAFTVAK